MTLRFIDWKHVALHMSHIHSFQQVELSHWGLIIDKLLNVQVVLIDPTQSLHAASLRVQGRRTGQGNLRAIRHK